MTTIQKEREITKHHSTSQYSVWIKINEDAQETEFIYIFSRVFRAWHMKTDTEILKFIDDIIDWHIAKINEYQKQNNQSIFNFIRYRFVFLIDTSKDNNIGFTGNKSEDVKIKSFYFSNPNEAKDFYIS